MNHLITEERRKVDNINFLSSPKIKPKWTQRFIKCDDCWKVFSGKWELSLPNKFIYFKEPQVTFGENFSIIGSPRWNELTLHVRLKILTESIKPPEGGAILYFLFKNTKNYYSIHFCLCKQKIEFIKRFQGHWLIRAEQEYKFKTNREYHITVTTSSGIHQCHIDGVNTITIHDPDISNGSVGVGTKYCDIEFSHISVSIP